MAEIAAALFCISSIPGGQMQGRDPTLVIILELFAFATPLFCNVKRE
ncbi:MAG: hypothetical protein JMN24_15865 [gamma proteobacterium endosymbiont of Lamellibrachia anaximandri]|nr:hypothetical protein [gamma proteobacterium endosymbiont of Lamellibrachia anaximandri]MBL3616739.1 hypothetical protein [gamma proteobacterium endosymbiont of Lamellibrachia anaximandri]